MTCLDVVNPACDKSTAEANIVIPTPTAPIDADACDALILKLGSDSVVLIPTLPFVSTKTEFIELTKTLIAFPETAF